MAANYASLDMGAEIADVSSHGPSHLTSGPSNLLLDRDDLMWVTGEAPQHVTIRIKDNHPPIRYVGWHVWQDYVTNPRTVIISSGTEPKGHVSVNRNLATLLASESNGIHGNNTTNASNANNGTNAPILDSLVLECSALPGAGTQLWELPSPIPTSHCYVQFKITSTFAPGPTYMNKLVLYSTHPGDGFQTRGTTSNANTSILNVSTQQQQQQNGFSNATTSGGYVAPTTTGLSVGGGGIPPRREPSPFRRANSNMNTPNQQYNNGNGNGGGNNSAMMQQNTPNGGRAGSVHMADLLAGLDDDIKRLHPIKTISPTKRPSMSHGRSISPSVMLPDAEEFGPQHQSETGNPQFQQLVVPPPPLPLAPPPPPPPPQVQYVQIPSPPPDPSGQEALMRVSALERAVELLTKAVERQNNELEEVRRLMLENQIQLHQQQMDRDRDREREREKERDREREREREREQLQKQQQQLVALAESTATAAAKQAANNTNTSSASNTANNQLQLIEFPETALKNYIEDVLAPRLSKHAKRTEARTLQQIDDHMHVLLKEIGAVVDERVERHLHKIIRDGKHPYCKALMAQSQQMIVAAAGGMSMNSQQNNNNNLSQQQQQQFGGSGLNYSGQVNSLHQQQQHQFASQQGGYAPPPHHQNNNAGMMMSNGQSTYEEVYGHGGHRMKPATGGGMGGQRRY